MNDELDLEFDNGLTVVEAVAILKRLKGRYTFHGLKDDCSPCIAPGKATNFEVSTEDFTEALNRLFDASGS